MQAERYPRVRGALIDMDGVLYDSMPRHALAWQEMLSGCGISMDAVEFHRMEGMTGRDTIRRVFSLVGLPEPSDEETAALYARKTEIFRSLGKRILMPGAAAMIDALREAGIRRVLVTGSGQRSLINAIAADYPGAFLPGDMVTSADYDRGKPFPDPYLLGLRKLGMDASEVMVVENAPLGVRAGKAAGCFTFGISTGPLPAGELDEAGADEVFSSMNDFAAALRGILS